MILESDGYALVYDNLRNRITIYLPQTLGTMETTLEPTADRKTEVTSDYMMLILMIVKYVFEKR